MAGLGVEVTGIDYSIWGVEHHNPAIKDQVLQGDFYQIIKDLRHRNKTYHVINADNVLEHVENCELFLNEIHSLCSDETLLMIKVPNDFSILQRALYGMNKIKSSFWVTDKNGEHNYYFSYDSLSKLGEKCGFKEIMRYGDFPIDLFLFDEDTNYANKSEVGHSCYLAKIAFENMLFGRSVEDNLKLHEAYAVNGIGRDINIVFRKR